MLKVGDRVCYSRPYRDDDPRPERRGTIIRDRPDYSTNGGKRVFEVDFDDGDRELRYDSDLRLLPTSIRGKIDDQLKRGRGGVPLCLR